MLAVGCAVMLLAGCSVPGPPVAVTVTEATYRQVQAVQGFDDASYSVEDDDDLEDLEELLAEYGITEASGDEAPQCPGGRMTEVSYTDADGETHALRADTCASDAFGQELDELVSEWRSEGVGTPVSP